MCSQDASHVYWSVCVCMNTASWQHLPHAGGSWQPGGWGGQRVCHHPQHQRQVQCCAAGAKSHQLHAKLPASYRYCTSWYTRHNNDSSNCNSSSNGCYCMFRLYGQLCFLTTYSMGSKSVVLYGYKGQIPIKWDLWLKAYILGFQIEYSILYMRVLM